MDAAHSSRPVCPDPTQGAPLNSKPKTQKTKPKKGKSVEIPVPEKADVRRDLMKVARKRPASK